MLVALAGSFCCGYRILDLWSQVKRLCYDSAVREPRVRPGGKERIVRARVSDEIDALLVALAALEPPIKTTQAIEEGIRLLARRYKVSGRRETTDLTPTKTPT